MIKITADGALLQLEIRAAWPTDQIFHLRFATGAEWTARLLAHALRSELENRLTKIRENAYNAGWKDAKNRVSKRQHFHCGWGD